MYGVTNIRKFVDDHRELIGDRAMGIIKRAESLSHNGVVSGGSIGAIMDDGLLQLNFEEEVMLDPEHIKIGLEALEKLR